MIRCLARSRDWNGFLRRAKKAFPKEHCEALWGDATVDGFRITKFSALQMNTDKNNSSTIDYDDEEIHRQMVNAARESTNFIGTVHTHPDKDYDTAASTFDHRAASKDGERVMGVVVIYKEKSKFVIKTDWWIPQPRIAFELTE